MIDTNNEAIPAPTKTAAQVQADAIFAAMQTYIARQLAHSQAELAGLLVRLEAALNANGPSALAKRVDELQERLARLERRA